MKGFNRKEGHLFIDDISLKDVAKKFGTPVYVYSANTVSYTHLTLPTNREV